MSTRYASGEGTFNDSMNHLFNNKEKNTNIIIDYEISYNATESDGQWPNDPVQEDVTWINWMRKTDWENEFKNNESSFIIMKILKDNNVIINEDDLNEIKFPLELIYKEKNDEVYYKIEEIEPKWGIFSIDNVKVEIDFNDNNDIIIKIDKNKKKDIINIDYNEFKRILEKIVNKLENIESNADFN